EAADLEAAGLASKQVLQPYRDLLGEHHAHVAFAIVRDEVACAHAKLPLRARRHRVIRQAQENGGLEFEGPINFLPGRREIQPEVIAKERVTRIAGIRFEPLPRLHTASNAAAQDHRSQFDRLRRPLSPETERRSEQAHVDPGEYATPRANRRARIST